VGALLVMVVLTLQLPYYLTAVEFVPRATARGQPSLAAAIPVAGLVGRPMPDGLRAAILISRLCRASQDGQSMLYPAGALGVLHAGLRLRMRVC